MENPQPKDNDSFSTAKSQFSNNASENSRTRELNKEPPNTTSKPSSCWSKCCRKKDSIQKSNENHPSFAKSINEECRCLEQCTCTEYSENRRPPISEYSENKRPPISEYSENKKPPISEYSEYKRRLSPTEINDSLTGQANEEHYNGTENEDLQEPNKEQLNTPSKSRGCCAWSKCCRKKTIDEPRSSSLIEVGGRKVVKTELALAKIVFFDDLSRTYEIMNGSFQDKLQEKATYTSAIFVMQPEGFTMCFDCRNDVPRYSDKMFQPIFNQP